MRFLIAIAVLVPAVAQPATVFHVSKDGPIASLEQARDAVRALKRQQGGKLKEPVTVYVHGGTYELSRPVELTPEDSGSAEAPATYRAWQSDKPVFSGGHAISGWKEVTVSGKHLWAAEIPGVKEGKWNFRELWVNGQRKPRARAPKEGFYRMAGVPDLEIKRGVDNSHQPQRRFQYSPGELQKFDNASDVEVVILHFWVSTRCGIASIDESNRMVNLAQPSSMRMTDGFGNPPLLARYYVENAFELLTAPGEWYLNRKTGIVYYMPMPGERVDRFEAVAPVVDHFLSLAGDPRSDKFVEYLTFHGLTFTYAEWWLPEDGSRGRYQQQASAGVPGAIRAYGMRNCAFEGCTVAHISSFAFHLSRGCTRDRIAGCEMFDLGAAGVEIGEPDKEARIAPDANGVVHDLPVEETHDIEIADNHIHDGGLVFHQAMGILIFQCYNNLISHNHIHDLFKNAIAVGWSWSLTSGKSGAHHNVIEWNHIHDIGKGWFNDGGAIYTLGKQPGTLIRYNLVHDIGSVVYGGNGLYLDQGSSEIVAEKNITYRTTGGGYTQTFGQHNTVRNNIFALGKVCQLQPEGGMAGLPKDVNSFLFEKNIVYWTPEQKLVRGPWRELNAKVVTQKNLYWQTDGGEVKVGPLSWGEWQGRGMDQGTLVADPLFVDPARGDFRLKPGSPALKIGFEPFELSAAGPRAEAWKAARE